LVTLQSYLQARALREQAAPRPRARCEQCQNPHILCYCAQLTRFDSQPRFAFLMHKRESKRTIATGRMAHLCLSNSLLFEGFDFSDHPGVQALLADPRNYCVVLYPGASATVLDTIAPEQKRALFPSDRQAWILVLDATWSQARRLWRFSRNLHALPRLCFTPQKLSRFTIRQQPRDWCYSTVEAVHEVLTQLEAKPPEAMLGALDWLVRQQGIASAVKRPRSEKRKTHKAALRAQRREITSSQ